MSKRDSKTISNETIINNKLVNFENIINTKFKNL